MSTSVRCLKLNVASALDIILRQNGLDQDERLSNSTTQYFLSIIRRCLNVRVQDRFVLIEISNIAFSFNLHFFSPSFDEILIELNGKIYTPPIQRSLELTVFNGITPVLDHNLDLNDFNNFHRSFCFCYF